MPAERAAAAGRLEVEFGVIEANAAAQQARDDIDNLLAANRLRRKYQPSLPDRRCVATPGGYAGDGDNVVMLVASQFAVANGGDNARDFALQTAQQIGRREIFDHGEAVAPIARFDGVEISSVFHRIFLRGFCIFIILTPPRFARDWREKRRSNRASVSAKKSTLPKAKFSAPPNARQDARRMIPACG